MERSYDGDNSSLYETGPRLASMILRTNDTSLDVVLTGPLDGRTWLVDGTVE